tara:strand:+ start:530 stop:865 length:336 start_codon:yes stop_codon:yes gene_type:complete
MSENQQPEEKPVAVGSLQKDREARTFVVVRQDDESGVSGVGTIVEGVEFSNGQVVVRWLTAVNSVAVFNSLEDFLKVHVKSHLINRTILTFSDGEETIYQKRNSATEDGEK